MVFHIMGIPHTVTSIHYISCAYTQKVLKLCKMLYDLGHEVYHYGCEGSDPVCTEHVDVVTEELRNKFYGVDFQSQQFKFDQEDECYTTFHKNSIAEITKRLSGKDFLLTMWGWGHQPVAEALKGKVLAVEPGIGYPDIYSKYRVFESYTWMSFVYGKYNYADGSFYDAVIPNYFDPNDFTFCEEKEDWFLYLGRFVKRKGIDVASQVIKEVGGTLKMAGQGKLIDESEGISIEGDHIDCVGFADVEKRRKLLSKAKAVFMPTYYIEPFGGVSIEAMLSGTPVITSDWGVFSENIIHGVTGYRCRTFEQFCWAANNVDKLSPQACYDWASQNYTMERVALMYQEYFETLSSLWSPKGWYMTKPGRTQLDWLNKVYPTTSSNGECFPSQPVNADDRKWMTVEPDIKLDVPNEKVKTLSILMPIKRLKETEACFQSMLSTMSGAHDIEVLCYVDDEDQDLRDCVDKYSKADNGVHFSYYNDKGKDQQWRNRWHNFLFKHCKGDYIYVSSEDVIYRTNNWDDIILSAFDDYPDKMVLIHPDDGGKNVPGPKELASMLFLTREWCELLGYVVPDMFLSMYNDTWVTFLADYNSRRILLEDVLIEHMHPWHDKAKLDRVHNKATEHNERSSKVWACTEGQRIADAQKIKKHIKSSAKSSPQSPILEPVNSLELVP